LKAIFAHCREGGERWWNEVVDDARSKSDKNTVADHSTLQFDLLWEALLLKNENFSEEKEWRLVLPLKAPETPSTHTLQFRYTRDTLVPYVAYPLNSLGEGGPIRCNDLIVGAGAHTSAEIGINLFLQAEGIRVLPDDQKSPIGLHSKLGASGC
jgi:hypothetical protein